jgi:hypothetical protein
MADYEYQKPTDTGFAWNLTQKVKKAIPNKAFIGTTVVSDKYLLSFDGELDPQEKADLDAIMADPATVYTPDIPANVVGSVLQITDIYETLDDFNAQTGINFEIYFVEGTVGSGVVDKILLIPDKPLATNEKNSVRSLFASLAEWI